MTKVTFKTLQKRIADERTKSATKLSAQTIDLCSRSKSLVPSLNESFAKYKERADLIDIEKAVIELLMLNGLRISEVLNILPSDVLSNGYIKIKGLKHSNDRLVLPINYHQYWQTKFKSLLPLKLYYSRFYFYRLFKRIGIYSKYGNNKYNSVTHYFRHEIVLSMKASGINDLQISEFLGHKSKNNIKYYINEKKQN